MKIFNVNIGKNAPTPDPGYTNEQRDTGVRELVKGIVLYARHMALEPNVIPASERQYADLGKIVRSPDKVKGIFTKDNTRGQYNVAKNMADIVGAYSKDTFNLDSASILGMRDEVKANFTEGYNQKIDKPLTEMAEAAKNIHNPRFFRGLNFADAVSKAEAELKSIGTAGGKYEVELSPKGLYETLSTLTTKLHVLQTLKNGSGEPSTLVQDLDKILSEQGYLQTAEKAFIALPENEAAAVIATQYGKLKDVVVSRPRKPKAPANSGTPASGTPAVVTQNAVEGQTPNNNSTVVAAKVTVELGVKTEETQK
jgi:hypothetical protein